MWIAAAMAVGSLVSANSARNAQMAAKAADAKLQRAKLEMARRKNTEDYVANTQLAKESAQKREINIESNRLDAESRIAETFAGSGISGQTVNSLDAEINASVVKNKYENRKALDNQLSTLSRNYSSDMNASADAARSIDTTSERGSFLGDLQIAAGGAAQGAAMGEKFNASKLGSAINSKLGFQLG